MHTIPYGLLSARQKLVADGKNRSALWAEETRHCLVPFLVSFLDARRIWLFGSVARGAASADSDVDVFVECGERFAETRFVDRLGIAIDAKMESSRQTGYCLPTDIIVWSAEEFAKESKSGHPFCRMISDEGIIIYE
ncbi:nucleotidyltransferase family protein [Acidithiobacillus sp. IBUN Pt1247-S3]|uniref:nucleotidyltransferase family protein n=1 Tax=Acidithiobacillus sp. IBUN Pt1247-S3 TaxID=3166642 RepID=UPI0034E508A2